MTSKSSRPLRAIPASSVSLCGEWRFAIDAGGIGTAGGWMAPGFDDSAWRVVTVPHTWNVMPEYATHEGVGWYRRAFVLPAGISDAHLRLRFEAVFYLARVWLNNKYLGEHEGGYTPFEFEVSDIARPGENVVAVQVDNMRATDRLPAHLWEGRSYGWRNYGGIVRSVSLKITSCAFITDQRIVAVPHLVGIDEADAATITATVTIRNASSEPLNGTLTVDILDDATGRSVLDAQPGATISLAPGESADIQQQITIPSPVLWHFDHPHLYRWSSALWNADGELLHSEAATFGIRLIELKETCFYLNGEPVRLVGLSRHADSPACGPAETTAVMAADYDDLKRLNMVIGRPVHYPQDEYIYDYCDRHGILLSPEVPAWQLAAGQMDDPRIRELEQQQIREMIAAAFNHPCIWAWSVGNELESDTVAGRAFIRDMAAYVRSLDPTRPLSFASYHLLVGRPWADATRHADFVMMNQYFGTWHGPRDALEIALDTIHVTWPDRTVMVSEFGFCPHWQHIEGPARIDPEQYYIIPEDASSDSPEADAMRCRVIREQMAVFRSRPFVAGAMLWCYQGQMGVVDDARNRRESWWVLRDEYSPVQIESVVFSPIRTGRQGAVVNLQTRGPVECDMPVYTLRGYCLRWAVTSPQGDAVFSEGSCPLPVLAPATAWTVGVEWPVPDAEYVVTLSVFRPTGFPVIERTCNARGEPLGRNVE